MPSICEVSFYQVCGHTINVIHTANPLEFDKHSLPAELPAIDYSSFTCTIEEGYTLDTLEVHYQESQSEYCSKGIKPGKGRGKKSGKYLTKYSAMEKAGRIREWKNLSNSFQLQFDHALRLEDLEYEINSDLTQEIEDDVGCKAMQLVFKKHGMPERSSEIYTTMERNIGKDKCETLVRLFEQQKESSDRLVLLERRRKVYAMFNTLNGADIWGIIPLEDRLHFLAPGFDTLLLTPLCEEPSQQEKKEENCSICFEKLHEGRVRKLPCGHYWHHSCISSWLEVEDNGSCPMCRKKWTVLAMPDLESAKAMEKFRKAFVHLLTDTVMDMVADIEPGFAGDNSGDSGDSEDAEDIDNEENSDREDTRSNASNDGERVLYRV